MRGIVWLTALLVLAGCASGGGMVGPDAEVREVLRLAGSRESDPPRDGSEMFVGDTLSAPAARAFVGVRRAYEELGIPFTFYEQDALRLGGYVPVLGDLVDERPSTWVDCGRGMTAEPYADRYEVSMAIATKVVPQGEGRSTVETVLRARARARDVSGGLLRCRSFGTLERRIAEMVRARVAR